MYVGVRARPDMLTYTSHVQYETMASKVFTTHDMEQEQASDTGGCHVTSCSVM